MLQLLHLSNLNSNSKACSTWKSTGLGLLVCSNLVSTSGAKSAFIHCKANLGTANLRYPVNSNAPFSFLGSRGIEPKATEQLSKLFSTTENTDDQLGADDFLEYSLFLESEHFKAKDLATQFSEFMNANTRLPQLNQVYQADKTSTAIESLKQEVENITGLIQQIPSRTTEDLPKEQALEQYGRVVKIYYELLIGHVTGLLEIFLQLTDEQIQAIDLDPFTLAKTIDALADWSSPHSNQDMVGELLHHIANYLRDHMDELPTSNVIPFKWLNHAYSAVDSIPNRHALVIEFSPPLCDYFCRILDSTLSEVKTHLMPSRENLHLARMNVQYIIDLVDSVANPDMDRRLTEYRPIERQLHEKCFPVTQDLVSQIQTYLLNPEDRRDDVDMSELMGLDQCQLTCLEHHALLAFLVEDISTGIDTLKETLKSLELVQLTVSEAFQDGTTMESALETHRHFKTILAVLKTGIRIHGNTYEMTQIEDLLDLIATSPSLAKTEVEKLASFLKHSDLQNGRHLAMTLNIKAYSSLAVNETTKGKPVNLIRAIKLQEKVNVLADQLAEFSLQESGAWSLTSNIKLLQYYAILMDKKEPNKHPKNRSPLNLKLADQYKKVSEKILATPACVDLLDEHQCSLLHRYAEDQSLDKISKQEKSVFDTIFITILMHLSDEID